MHVILIYIPRPTLLSSTIWSIDELLLLLLIDEEKSGGVEFEVGGGGAKNGDDGDDNVLLSGHDIPGESLTNVLAGNNSGVHTQKASPLSLT